MVCDTFGREALVELVGGVQAECDVHGSRLLQRFLEARSLARVVKDITSHKRAGEAGACLRCAELAHWVAKAACRGLSCPACGMTWPTVHKPLSQQQLVMH